MAKLWQRSINAPRVVRELLLSGGRPTSGNDPLEVQPREIDDQTSSQRFVESLKLGERPVLSNNEFRAAADEMTQQRIRVGAAQSRVDRSVQRTEDLKLSVSTALSNEVDTDFAESTMEVQKAKALLEAAQSITATIGSMSLFQRLG